jgi:hypothetical protein
MVFIDAIFSGFLVGGIALIRWSRRIGDANLAANRAAADSLGIRWMQTPSCEAVDACGQPQQRRHGGRGLDRYSDLGFGRGEHVGSRRTGRDLPELGSNFGSNLSEPELIQER